jgi:hypothetical protein
MKTFKVEGWYRYNDEKDFEVLEFNCETVKIAIQLFLSVNGNINFYKIDIKEII